MLKLALIVGLAITLFLVLTKPAGYQPLSFLVAKTPAPSSQISLIAVGDIMLGRTVMTTSLDKKDVVYPFRRVAEKLKQADLVFANLESPVISNCPRAPTGTIFCADPQMLQGLVFSGVDVVTLANNHTQNYGQKGFEETIQNVENYGIQTTGRGELVVKMIGDTKFGFLGFEKSQQTSPKLTSVERELIKDSNSKVDILIVGMHWGVEYQHLALPGVRTLAKELFDLGVDVVVGSHPHWVQDIEYINSVPVYYSLGNFVFDQPWSEETKKGLAVKLIFENKKFVRDERMPIYMKSHAQPEWVE
jgi:poly-gamma-glutamate synthesis protein (capsule biosynthesis protein)